MADVSPSRITSPSNPLIKRLKGLDRKKGRSETGLFLVEGARLVEQGLRRGWHADTVLIGDGGASREHVRQIAENARAAGARVQQVPDRLISAISRKDNPQTVIAAFEQRHAELGAAAVTAQDIWIALYEVRDPGNLGTIIRTADCAGMAGIILLETCCDPYSVEAVRATMGSVFDVPVYAATFAGFEAWRRKAGLTTVAASVNGSVRHDAAGMGAGTVIVMGNEQAGLPANVEAACDRLAIIPMRGGADSLNLAQATAIMAYDAWRATDYRGART
jgi:TrmH family RNA methyltransferase